MLIKSILVRFNFCNVAIHLSMTIFGGFRQMEQYLFGLTKLKVKIATMKDKIGWDTY